MEDPLASPAINHTGKMHLLFHFSKGETWNYPLGGTFEIFMALSSLKAGTETGLEVMGIPRKLGLQ